MRSLLESELALHGCAELLVLIRTRELPFTSGGGFSNVFARPEYQDSAVTTYFDNYDP